MGDLFRSRLRTVTVIIWPLCISRSSCRGSSKNTLIFQDERDPLREEKEKDAFVIVFREKLFSREQIQT